MNNQVTDVSNPGVRPADLAALRVSLHEQRVFRQEQLRQIKAAAQSRADRAPGQLAASQTEVHTALAACARMVLADVEEALERMDQGRYGRCRLCTRPISLDRLEIVPQARYCTRCQMVKEAGR
ncbi:MULTISPECIES: TraR/DksA family transcriptional regulator [Streptomyces]|uniref:TraR/DksA family transcriptional regulator n=1 Tax=Streptomyces TaxID=1883 RepID=UPI00224971FE|nr:TraR/DksA C4-type zinc finger protein [Streptomyces sp. JHD 1]MCX2971425.1 TraR/DksA C4-type zinc finger protein [Streptomyces sp. JHD 1]